MSLSSKPVVFLTGASSGIGAATAAYFLQQGWRVVATARNPAKILVTTSSPDLRTFPLDVTAEASLPQVFRDAWDCWGRLDVLVNNAGFALNGPIEGLTAEQIDQQFATNVRGLIGVTRAALPYFRKQRSGVIINISSIGGRVAFPFAAVYNATKFAIEGLSESLRYELEPHRIRVKLVEPGGIRTRFIDSIHWGTHPAYETELHAMQEMTRQLNEQLPGPEGVAQVIYRAATDGSARLRYPALPGPYLWMRALLPDWVWRRLIRSMLARHAQRA